MLFHLDDTANPDFTTIKDNFGAEMFVLTRPTVPIWSIFNIVLFFAATKVIAPCVRRLANTKLITNFFGGGLLEPTHSRSANRANCPNHIS